MDPIPAETQLHQILADLDAGKLVFMESRGKVCHADEQCGIPWEKHPVLLPYLRLVPRPYIVELTYPPTPRGKAGPVQPKARVIRPKISACTVVGHPHLYVSKPYACPKRLRLCSGEGRDSWACPLSPQTTDWNWGEGATIRYLDQVALWVLKTAVWTASGGSVLSLGRWMGPATPHGPADLLASMRPSDPCNCGSGKTYKTCHMKLDLARIVQIQLSK